METIVKNAEPVKLRITDRRGLTHIKVFNGVFLTECRQGEEVYRHEDGRLVVYVSDFQHQEAISVVDPEDLRDLLDPDDYVEVMNALGITPEIEL